MFIGASVPLLGISAPGHSSSKLLFLQGDARVIRCLEESREHLSDDCKISIFDHMTRMSEDIDFNKPLKDACSSEIKENCEGVNPGHSRVVRCLQEGKRRKYSDSCKQVCTDLSQALKVGACAGGRASAYFRVDVCVTTEFLYQQLSCTYYA